jgi:transketolase
MAIAERWLNARFGNDVVDYRIYALGGDGDMMEGICAEAASLAGHLGLHKLLWIYDNNKITIEGKTALAFTEDVALRFKAYGWFVQHVADANDLKALTRAIKKAQKQTARPSLIVVDSHIGYGAPTKQDTHGAHGEPLGDDEIAKTKAVYGWPPDAKFLVPEDVSKHMGKAWRRGRKLEKLWQEKLATLAPSLAVEWKQIQNHELPAGWDKDLPVFPADPKGLATRESNGKVMNAVAKNVPWLLGGAADLAPSTKTNLTGLGDFQKGSYSGRNFHFGVREHAMTGIINGMALCHLRAFGSGFLIFSDYARGSLRLGAVMELPVIHVFTHDSIGVGEDGPTHQPIEQIASLRAIPHMTVIRPADANEVAEAWRVVMAEKKHPIALALTRQAVPTLDRTKYAPATGLRHGAYILSDTGGQPDIILIGTGSELSLCVEAGEKLKAEGVNVRVVSMPSCELFDRQPAEYRQQVLPVNVRRRLAVEAGTTQGWHKYVGLDGAVIGRDGFGASAPFKEIYKQFGFTTDNVYSTAKKLLAAR